MPVGEVQIAGYFPYVNKHREALLIRKIHIVSSYASRKDTRKAQVWI